jgi:hypothetical protein
MGKDPKKLYEKLVEYAKKFKTNKDAEPDPNMNKYKIGVGLYLAACLGIYELKKERAVVITHEDTIDAIKKSQVSVIYVVKERTDKSEEESKKNGEQRSDRNNFRKIYLKIDGVEHVSYVPEIGLFY